MTGLWGNTAARHCARESVQERLRDFTEQMLSTSPRDHEQASARLSRGETTSRAESRGADDNSLGGNLAREDSSEVRAT